MTKEKDDIQKSKINFLPPVSPESPAVDANRAATQRIMSPLNEAQSKREARAWQRFTGN